MWALSSTIRMIIRPICVGPSGSSVGSSVQLPAAELLGGRQSVLDGELHEAGDVGHAEFLHKPASVGIDGLRREIHECRDPRARVAFDHELKDLAFSHAETVQWPGFVGALRARSIDVCQLATQVSA